MNYSSFEVIESTIASGVAYKIAKISFGRRLELTQRIRELANRKAFVEAGPNPSDQMDAFLLAREIDRIYLLWGLQEVTGLELDGLPATPEMLASAGPEDLCREALTAIKEQCALSEAERKN